MTILLQQIFISIHRQLCKEQTLKNDYLYKEIESAIQYFNENYNKDIVIEDYASSRGMSISWFIRNFKQYTGTTPMQYILSIRMMNAQMLLETTNYNITEIGTIIGYDNPLYFSRIFKKQDAKNDIAPLPRHSGIHAFRNSQSVFHPHHAALLYIHLYFLSYYEKCISCYVLCFL